MTKERLKRMARMCASLFHAGCIGFGGGSALIPVLQQSIVQEDKLVSQDEFDKDVVVASITPGALPVEIAIGIGKKVAGIPGMILAPISIAAPGVVLTVLVVSLLSRFGSVITKQIDFMAVGVSAYIIYVLFGYIEDTVKEAKANGKFIACLITLGVAVAVTAGKQVQKIFDLEHTPILAISTANLMLITLFMVLFLRGHYYKKNVIPAFAIAIVYLLCVGKAKVINCPPLRYTLVAVMLIMMIWGVQHDLKQEGASLRVNIGEILKECVIWLVFMAIFALPVFFLWDGTLNYAAQGLLSSILSFGGGDAYLAVAGGMFVTTGIVMYADFYNKIVPVANAFPGSILCKVLSGVGFFAAYRATGSWVAGYLCALCGMMVSIGGSGLTFGTLNIVYEEIEKTNLIALLREVIRPVVSGLLITVGLQFYYSCIQTGAEASWPNLCAPILCGAMAVGCWIFVKKTGINRPLRMVIACALVGLLCCNLFGIIW